MKINCEKFEGIVYFKEWTMCPDGNNKLGVGGLISIREASKVAGFDPGQRESNWIARVESKDGMRSFNILGCQVRSVYQGPINERHPTNHYYMD